MLINDIGIYPAPPALAWGPAGTVQNDPTFNTPILRVTDQDTNGGKSFSQYSAFWDCFGVQSINGASKTCKITFQDLNGGVYLATLDYVNRTVTIPVPFPIPPNGNQNPSTVLFSRQDDDICYFLSAAILWKYQFSMSTWTKVVDFSTVCAGTVYTESRGWSESSSRILVVCKDANFSVDLPGCPAGIVYDYSAQKIVRTFTLAEAVIPSNSGSSLSNFVKGNMDRGGKWYVFSCGCIEIDNQNSHGVTPSPPDIVNIPPRGAYDDDHYDLGNGVIAGSVAPLPTVNANISPGWKKLASGPAVNGVSTPTTTFGYCGPPANFSQARNFSLRINDSDPDQWMICGYFQSPWTPPGSTPPYPDTPAFGSDEIFAVPLNGGKPDGSTCRRLCHHHTSEGSVVFDSNSAYWARQIHPCGDQIGSAFMYSSTQGTDRIDIYIGFIDQPTSTNTSVPIIPPASTALQTPIVLTAGQFGELQQITSNLQQLLGSIIANAPKVSS